MVQFGERWSQTSERTILESEVADWELTNLPTIPQRREFAVRAQFCDQTASQMQEMVRKKIQESTGVDPAILKRTFDINLSLAAIENYTDKPMEIFLACRIGLKRILNDPEERAETNVWFTKSYKIKASSRYKLKENEEFMAETWLGSYKKLVNTLIDVEVWSVSWTGFNHYVAKGRKSLYDVANDSVFQEINIVSTDIPANGRRLPIGALFFSAVVAEQREFKLTCSNWTFTPTYGTQVSGSKTLKLQMTKEFAGGSKTNFTTTESDGPLYSWEDAGEFPWHGTKLGLSHEILKITMCSNGNEVAKAVVSLGGAGDYPVVTAKLKNLTLDPSSYVAGEVGGNLMVEMSPAYVDKDVKARRDEDSSIPPPSQPTTSLVSFYLKPDIQYLVVEVQSAIGIPIANVDAASSNPLCRVKYDGNVQQTITVFETCSPIWNQKLYFPVILPAEKMRTDKTLYSCVLPMEMASKGYLEVEIWHVEVIPTEFLGSCKIDPKDFRTGIPTNKSLIEDKYGSKKVVDEGYVDDTAPEKATSDSSDDGKGLSAETCVDPRLTQLESTKVYTASNVKLVGSALPCVTQPKVNFCAYFLPDFPSDFAFPPQRQNAQEEMNFDECYLAWNDKIAAFQKIYRAYFPDCFQVRNFSCLCSNAEGNDIPLPLMLKALALPKTLGRPGELMHWVNLFHFVVPPRQRGNGLITSWSRIEDILSLRRGSVQDHALLLCAALLGLGKDAFVCKGIVQGGLEHAWVMTREAGAIVTFWETTNATKYHLAGRWSGNRQNSKATVENRWNGRNIKQGWDDKSAVAQIERRNRRDRLLTMAELESLPISPWKELCDPSAITVVPYESIEVIFNNIQLWGNLVNHHPSSIYYDMEDDVRSWWPLCGPAHTEKIRKMQGSSVPISKPLSIEAALTMQEAVEAELKESIRLSRVRSGLETYFQEDESLQSALERWLDFLEEEYTLDTDWIYGPKGGLKAPWGAPSPFNSKKYVENAKSSWEKYWKTRNDLLNARSFMPVRVNHVLSGVPVHFSSTDVRDLRGDLLKCIPLQEYFELDSDNVYFVTCARVCPKPQNISSLWIFIGAEIPLPAEVSNRIADEDMKDQLKLLTGQTWSS